MHNLRLSQLVYSLIISLTVTSIAFAGGGNGGGNSSACGDLPSPNLLRSELNTVVDGGGNAGLSNEMWATIVNRSGVVCAVVYSGDGSGDQWPGSRVISAQKANTANAFSLPGGVGLGLPLSTANLYSAVQPGGSLFGLQESNPVDTKAAYHGNPNKFGEDNDPMVGRKIGGVNVFGGGLALYNTDGELIGALGVSGDTSCSDHIIAWKLRDALGLDNIPGGVNGSDDNMILDTTVDAVTGHTTSASGFGHPSCGFGEDAIIDALPVTNPVGP